MQHRMHQQRSLRALLLILFLAGLVAGCDQNDGAMSPTDGGTPPTSELLRLPVSLNDVMVALVNHAADPIWIAAWRNPETDEDWRNLERMAYQLEVAGAILVIPGTGPRDEAWARDADWRRWSDKLRTAGERAVEAVEARDLSAISVVGDELVEVCEGCHRTFKSAEPTGGKFGELSPTAQDFEPRAPEEEG